MSSTISTRDELSSNRKNASGRCWRVVEAQNQISTTKLTDTSAEQHALELLIEETKPPVPRKAVTSIFCCRRRSHTCGLSKGVRDFGRWVHARRILCIRARRNRDRGALLFPSFVFSKSPDTKWPANAGEYTAFASEIRDEEIDRSDIAAVRFPVGGMDASDRLRALPDSRRYSARGGHRIHQVCFGARPRAPCESCDTFLPGVRAQRARGPSNMATAFRQQWRTRGLRIAAPHARFQQGGLSGRPAYRIDAIGSGRAKS